MSWYVWLLIGVAGGYAASIYTWPWIRTKINGVREEIAVLEERARALRGKIGL